MNLGMGRLFQKHSMLQFYAVVVIKYYNAERQISVYIIKCQSEFFLCKQKMLLLMQGKGAVLKISLILQQSSMLQLNLLNCQLTLKICFSELGGRAARKGGRENLC